MNYHSNFRPHSAHENVASLGSPASVFQLSLPVSRFFAAALSGEPDAMLATFASDGVIDDSGRRFAGRAAINEWIEREFEHARARIFLRQTWSSCDAVVVEAAWASRFYKGAARLIFRLEAEEIKHLQVFGE